MFVCMHHGDSCRVDDRAVKLIVGEVSDDLYQQKEGALVDQVPGSFIYYRILLLYHYCRYYCYTYFLAAVSWDMFLIAST